MTNNHKGFTLTEILIVVSIIVLLGIAVLVGINPMTQIFKGYDTRRKADLNLIKIALEGYYTDHDCYPVFPLTDSQGRPSYACDSNFLSPYLNIMPCDPNSKTPYPIYLLPEDSTCPQQYAVYAPITFLADSQINSISSCPQTIVVHSPDMSVEQISFGCNAVGNIANGTLWGCKSGACTEIAHKGQLIPCSPNYYEDFSCGKTASDPLCPAASECKP